MKKVVCPRCGQDWVVKVIIKPLSEEIRLCPECDAFWRPDQPISRVAFADYGSYVTSKGLSEDWALLEQLGPVEIPITALF